jgi:hypothetical protein
MFALRTHLLLALRSVIEARASREAEILVSRQQLAMLNRKSPARLRPRNIGRLMLVWLLCLFKRKLEHIDDELEDWYRSYAADLLCLAKIRRFGDLREHP